MHWIAFIIGLCAGLIGGLAGLGGGIVIIPSLVLFLNFSQHQAQGATLAAMIPPIGFLAAYEYYKSGHVNIPVALCIALGFLIGGLFGAKIGMNIDPSLLKKIFGMILFVISIKFIFFS